MLALNALTYTSCDNDSDNSNNNSSENAILTTDEITTSLKTDIAIEDVAILVNDQFEAKIGITSNPATPAAPYTSMLPANAEVSSVDLTSGTPAVTTRTITITFGANDKTCVFRGHTLKGQIILVHPFTTSATKTMTVTFNNFTINGNTIEGKGDWKQEMVATPTAHSKATLTMTDIKYTTSIGTYLRNGWIVREITNGYSTRLDLTDDVNSVNEAYVTLSPTNYLLSSFTIATLNTPLVYKTSCSLASSPIPFAGSGTHFIIKGTHSAVIKFGTGDCDNSSRLAIDLKLQEHFTAPIQYNSNLYAIVPVTDPPTTPPTNAELIAKFDAKFDAIAVPFTLE